MIHNSVLLHQSYKKGVEALVFAESTAGVFDKLRESTVRSWYVPRTFQLKADVKKRWEEGGAHLARSGRPTLMSKYPLLEAYVADAIAGIRAGGGVVNSVVISSFFRGYCRVKEKELLKKHNFSRRYCRSWMKAKFPSWTYKKGTTSGQKLPSDWKEQMDAMGKRVSAAAAKYEITHPCFIINWDQTAVLLMQSSHYTYHERKQKQVPMVGKEEKRQITAVVASTLGGDLLPMQLIFKGQDKDRTKQKAVPALNELTVRRTAGWHLTQTYNHWSSLQSMKDYITRIIRPWVNGKGRELKFKESPHCVLILDCWAVHTSVEFRVWMKANYPKYHLVYVPAGCTGVAQPADVILQRPFKAGVVNAFNHWMTYKIHHLIKGGAAPSEVKVDSGMTVMKPLLVEWVWSSWRDLKDRGELIVKGWGKCGLGEVLNAAKQVEAMRFCMNIEAQGQTVVLGVEEQQDVEVPDIESEGEDETDETADASVEGTMNACLER
jgi:hypothetical protein